MTKEENYALTAEGFDTSASIPTATRDLYMLKAKHPEIEKMPNILSVLIKDRSVNHPIFFGTNNYENLSAAFLEDSRMSGWAMRHQLDKENIMFQPRAEKEANIQSSRTKKRGEVLTPLDVINQMIDVLEEEWKSLSLTDYLQTTVLEICCGEGPFLVQRYDPISGESIAVEDRKGVLDRKLHRISKSKKVKTRKAWKNRAYQAYRSVYGYEYQGDSLFLGRENLLFNYIEHHYWRWGTLPPFSEVRNIAKIISWNLFQMDGLKGKTLLKPGELHSQMELLTPNNEGNLIEAPGVYLDEKNDKKKFDYRPLVTLWEDENDHAPTETYRRHYGDDEMRFDVVIGNPAYQEESVGNNANDTPIYHTFFDGAVAVADKVLLITPGRFLFNAGGTPKDWNEKMLSDEHLKIVLYEPKSNKIFPNTSISGGVAVFYRDNKKKLGPIGVFTPYEELNSIMKKVEALGESTLSDQVTNRGLYKYSEIAYKERPEEMKLTADRRVAPSAFKRMPEIFTDFKPQDSNDYIRIYGVQDNDRVMKWVRKDFISPVDNLDRFKVVISKADGAAGTVGNPIPARISGKPVILEPGVGFNETFISIGAMNSVNEAKALEKYLKTKFARAMLGVLKVTQNNAKPTWAKIPVQNFGADSDIDWSQSIGEIDKQLYKKYGLSPKEIKFIEEYIEEMA